MSNFAGRVEDDVGDARQGQVPVASSNGLSCCHAVCTIQSNGAGSHWSGSRRRVGIWLTGRRSERNSSVVVFGLPYPGLFAVIIATAYVCRFHIERMAFMLSGAGLVLSLTGVIVLVRYIRANPVQHR